MLESLIDKVAGLKPDKFVKKKTPTQVFPVDIAKFFRTPILKKLFERLLLRSM